MSQPVRVSDTSALDARLTGEAAARSIAGQIEFWARLGRASEPPFARGPGPRLVPGRRFKAAFGMPSVGGFHAGAPAGSRTPQDPTLSALRTGRFTRTADQDRLGWEANLGSFRQPPVPSRQKGKTVKPGCSAAERVGANSWTEYLDRRRIVANDKGNTRDGVSS